MSIMDLNPQEWLDLGISLGVVAVVLVLGRWLVRIILGRLARRLAGATQTELDDRILEAVRPPIFWLIVVAAVQVALDRLQFVRVQWGEQIDDVLFVLYLLGIVFLVSRLFNSFFLWYRKEQIKREEEGLDIQLINFIRRVLILVILLIALSIVLSRFDVEISGLVATLGIGSLAIALAAQASLGDIFSGIVIMADRPFRVGDRIEILDLDTWGDVTDVGMRSTRIRTRDNRTVIVPNSLIGKSLIVNHSFPDDHYRIEVHVGIAYGTDIERARSVLIEAARGISGTWEERDPEALLMELAQSAMIFRVRVWIQSYVDTRRITDRLNTAIQAALDEAGVESPYPQMDVHHHIDTVDPERYAELQSISGRAGGAQMAG